MSSTQLTTAAPAGRELASREIDGTNDWTELAGRANEGLEVSPPLEQVDRPREGRGRRRQARTSSSSSTSPARTRSRPSITRSRYADSPRPVQPLS